MRYKFSEVFEKNQDGSLTPKNTIKIGGVMLGAKSIRFTKGVKFAGMDIFEYFDQDIEANEREGILTIEGFYN